MPALFLSFPILLPSPTFVHMSTDNQRLGDRIEAMEQEVKAWSKATRKKLLFRLAQLGLKDRVKLAKSFSKVSITKDGAEKEEFLYKSVRARLIRKQGDLEGAAFSFAKQGIYLHHGVGKHRKMGSAVAVKSQKPWLNVIDKELNELADLLESEYADIAAGELKISIPGVFETNIKIG